MERVKGAPDYFGENMRLSALRRQEESFNLYMGLIRMAISLNDVHIDVLKVRLKLNELARRIDAIRAPRRRRRTRHS